MKRIGLGLIALALWAAPPSRAQDAATEQRLRELSGKIEDLVASQDALRARLEELTKELANVREVQNRPAPVYASHEDLKRLTDAVNSAISKVDAKRVEDNQSIRDELRKFIKTIESQLAPPPPPLRRLTTPTPRETTPSDTSSRARDTSSSGTNSHARGNTPPETPDGPDRFIKYAIADGDTLGAIADACRKKGLKVTSKQIQDANPGLKPTAMKVGREIRIPVPPGWAGQ